MPRRSLTIVLALGLTLLAAAPAAAAPPFPDQIDLPTNWRPEGITAGAGNTIYVGSVAGGAIWAGNVRTGEGDTFVGPWGGAATGLEFEADANRLWAAGGPTGTVRVYDATSGELLEAYTFETPSFLNDVAIVDGAAYVTDSFNAWLNVIPLGPNGELPDPADVTTLALDGIPFEEGEFNANGIVATRGWLIVVDSVTGGLYRVDPATGDATAIDTGGVSVARGDGLELRGSTLYVLRNTAPDDQIEAFRLGPDLTTATSLGDPIDSPQFSVPTTLAFQAGSLWVVNARFGVPTTEFYVTQVPAKP